MSPEDRLPSIVPPMATAASAFPKLQSAGGCCRELVLWRGPEWQRASLSSMHASSRRYRAAEEACRGGARAAACCRLCSVTRLPPTATPAPPVLLTSAASRPSVLDGASSPSTSSGSGRGHRHSGSSGSEADCSGVRTPSRWGAGAGPNSRFGWDLHPADAPCWSRCGRCPN